MAAGKKLGRTSKIKLDFWEILWYNILRKRKKTKQNKIVPKIQDLKKIKFLDGKRLNMGVDFRKYINKSLDF